MPPVPYVWNRSICSRIIRSGYRHYKNYIQCRETKNYKNIQVYTEIICGFAVFNFFDAEKIFFRDSVFLDFVISDSRRLCRRKLKHQEKRNRENNYFKRQQNKIARTTNNFAAKCTAFNKFGIFVFPTSYVIFVIVYPMRHKP